MHPSPSAVVCDGLTFHWPDGTPVLDDLTATFGTGRTGVIGDNGSGKSTLLQLISGELRPTGGHLGVSGTVRRFAQDLPLSTGTVADLVGVAARRAALQRIEGGSIDPADFAEIGDDWDVVERLEADLAAWGVTEPDVLDRPLRTLSGGQAMLVGLLGARQAARSSAESITLLDEPTNNLDRVARRRLLQAVQTWPGVLIVVSHDRELLDTLDATADLTAAIPGRRPSALRMFGGTWSEYQEVLQTEREAAMRAVRDAQASVRREKRQLEDTQVKLDRRARTARTAEREKRVPKIIAHGRRMQAEVSAGRLRVEMEGKLDLAQESLVQAQDAIRDDDVIRVDLPGTAVPWGRSILRLVGAAVRPGAAGGIRPVGDDGIDDAVDLLVRGPERIALIGPNGSGKTTLLRQIVEHTSPLVDVAVPVGHLGQRIELPDDVTVLDHVRAGNPDAPVQQVRAGLARFLIGKAQVPALLGTLSGGERFRVALSRVLLADPAPQLLILDEPTNNLDISSVRALTEALESYRGALLVASHDERLLDDLGIERRWSREVFQPWGGWREMRRGRSR